jgi:hypothetical protein
LANLVIGPLKIFCSNLRMLLVAFTAVPVD